MSKEISLYKSNKIELPTLKEEAHLELSKGWSFSYVYYLREIRDIFLLIKKYGYGSCSFIMSKCKANNILPEGSEFWTERNILERLNALKNFNLISLKGELNNPNIFQSELGSDLTIDDVEVFIDIYFSYFRFREIASWMINPYEKDRMKIMSQINRDNIENNSKIIFPFISEGRFVNSFFFEIKDNADVFYINKNSSDMMRFWDVFIKWGTTLGLIDKFPLKWSDVNVVPLIKSLSCVYFKKKMFSEFSLIDFIKMKYKSNYIYTPQLILDIVIEYKYSLDDIKNVIVDQSLNNKNLISMQRTSEIFIEEKERVLLPMHRNSYISHLLIL